MTDVIMYHYIREPDPRYPYLHHMTPDAFDRQVTWLKHYHRDFELTFDDGLRDHMLAADILEKHGLRGTFFVCSQPLTEGAVLDVHRIHMLAGKLGGTFAEEVYEAWNGTHQEWTAEAYPLQRSDKYVKQLLNYEVTATERKRILDSLECDRPPASVADWYMSADQIRELHNRGHTIGTHTHSHPVLSRLDRLAQRQEIDSCMDYVAEWTGEDPTRFSYPYGGRASYNDDTQWALQDSAVAEAYDVRDESWDICCEDHLTIPRRDCTTFPEAR